MHNKVCTDLERQYYDIATKTVDKKIESGKKAHSNHIVAPVGMKQTIKMFNWIVFDSVMELKSEPFLTLEEAKHFSEVFNDSFLYDSYCVEENGKFYVYSGWVRVSSFSSYSVVSKGLFYEFSNYS